MSRGISIGVQAPDEHVAGERVADWSAAGLTHVGLVRRTNQDAWLAADRLFAVADGMGGHAHGDLASRLIMDELGQLDTRGTLAPRIAAAEEAVRRARHRLQAVPGAASDGSGSTVAILLVEGREAALLWAGDSRVYRLRADRLELLTRDHSVVQELLDSGQLSEAEAQAHPMRNRLTRAIGTTQEIELEIRRFETEPGDRFLLCTDGLHGPVPPTELVEVIAGSTLPVAVGALIEAALARGARDNVTAVLAEAPAAPPPRRSAAPDDVTALGPAADRAAF